MFDKNRCLQKIWKIQSLFFNKVAEQLQATAFVVPSFQYT